MVADDNPFSSFADPVPERTELRRQIEAAKSRPEPACVEPLLELARMPPSDAEAIRSRTEKLVEQLRSRSQTAGMSSLLQEYSLSTREGIALMSLAEAMLRTPDAASRDALIRDKVGKGNWRNHIGTDRSLFVNASSWGLLLTGRITRPADEAGLGVTLSELLGRVGEPVIRSAVEVAMRLLGDQFVAGQTIKEALSRARKSEARGFLYSYDMLGEAAVTAGDAERYFGEYESAIRAIGDVADGRPIHEAPGISIKLSALHPRYERAQRWRVMEEMLPRVRALCIFARRFGIGLNIDAEEADRLDLSLDILEALAFDPDLKGWDGLGFVVQAYGKRAPMVIDWLVDLAERSGRRIMVRLVKGAYWDSEIKRAQLDLHADYPVFTRKVHTDVSYIACAQKMLQAPERIYPQFATHNAQSVASIMHMAGAWRPGRYEFQCLYGMGEPLYLPIVSAGDERVPCRIYAPVGSHHTLLAYLVRRLLENGANSSFVNQVADPDADLEDLAEDPVALAEAIKPLGSPHPKIGLPKDFLGDRVSPVIPDLTADDELEKLASAFAKSAKMAWTSEPPSGASVATEIEVRNPADRGDKVGIARFVDKGAIDDLVARTKKAEAGWSGLGAARRADMLSKAAELLEARMPEISGLIIREAGKTAANALGDVREAIDFLRYYADEARRRPDAVPLGTIVCISPWNFPLAIFLGQVSAALAAGNCVLAKPAEETPLVAAAAVRLLHEAGVPGDVLHLFPGAGDIGAALVQHPQIDGVVFTGSTEVGRLINKSLAGRLRRNGQPLPLIAETGGQNVLIVDSTALAEQVVKDVLVSAFDSAGQRCSALRLLCIQDDVADRVLEMVREAMSELKVGNPAAISTDVGPVISAEARDKISDYVARRAGSGLAVTRAPLADGFPDGYFVPPTIIELSDISELEEEVFGPVLHVVRYKRRDRDRLISQINALGYGLTFGLHSRLDEEAAEIAAAAEVGNVYINRNIVGAVVGVQPFGGHGLSGTGPKAGGPLYLNRMLQSGEVLPIGKIKSAPKALLDWAETLDPALCPMVEETFNNSPLGHFADLPSPVGETDTYEIEPRGEVLIVPETHVGLVRQLAAVMATGNKAVIDAECALLDSLPAGLTEAIFVREDAVRAEGLVAALIETAEVADGILQQLAERDGPIVVPQAGEIRLDLLVREKVISTDTTAAGGNASLMTLSPV